MARQQVEILTEQVLAALARHLCDQARYDMLRRYVVGIAGIPGSGKSTLASQLVERINDQEKALAVVIPMDGFHMTNRRLEQLGLLHDKGSPTTFDAQGYVDLLRRARDASASLVFPIYDRGLHEPVLRDEPGQRFGPATRIIITEGNYLLLNEEPWTQLQDVLDECWLLDTPVTQARRWILARHERGGRDRSSALDHYSRTDATNAQAVLESMRDPDRRLAWPPS